jgi:hypothetical protein
VQEQGAALRGRFAPVLGGKRGHPATVPADAASALVCFEPWRESAGV